MKKLFHIPAANSSTTDELILALRVGEKHCCFAITGISGKKVYQLAYYSSNEINEHSLAELFADHPALNNAFHKVVVCSDLPQSILVPVNHFKPGEAEKILKNIYPLNDQFFTIAQTIPGYNFYNIYSIPKGVNDWLKRKFPGAEYFHDHSVSIRNMSGEADLRVDCGIL